MKYILVADKDGRILTVTKGPEAALSGLREAWEDEHPQCTVALVDSLPEGFDITTHAYVGGKFEKRWPRRPTLEERLGRVEHALVKAGLLEVNDVP